MKRLLATTLLSLACFAANAEWVVLGQSSSGDRVYADPATKKRTGNFVRIWEILDYKTPKVTNGKAYHSDRAYMQYDCAEGTAQILQITLYSGKMAAGESVQTDYQPGVKAFVAPGTNGENKFNFACQ
jgi:hypothetical protein